jgi:invasion protein IalB
MTPSRHNALFYGRADVQPDACFAVRSLDSSLRMRVTSAAGRVVALRGAGGDSRGAASWLQFEGLRRQGLTMSSANRWLFWLAPALLALSVFGGSAAPANAQGTVRSVHNDWQIRCDTPPGAQGEQCALIQSVTAEDRANVGLTVIVLKTADQKSRLMRVVAPMGVLLPSGLGLKIDQADVGRAGFVRCLPNGCVAEVVMDEDLVKKMRAGQTATFIIFQTPEEGIGFPMSLKGFGEGYDKLP